MAAQQIELSYYKDSKGRYHLFSFTSCGVTIDPTQDLMSQYRKNTWLDNGATTSYSVKSILRKQAVNLDGVVEQKDMVLIKLDFCFMPKMNFQISPPNGVMEFTLAQ